MNRIVTGKEVLRLIRNNAQRVGRIYLVSPFLSERATKEVLVALSRKRSIDLVIITKWEPLDLLLGYSEIGAFKAVFAKSQLKKWRVRVLIASHLHAKVFMLGKTLGVVGSMNLTNAGFMTNAELGMSIYGRDAKLNTLEKRIKEIETRSYELSLEAFRWKVEKELPRFESKAKAIRMLRKALERERLGSLGGFVPGTVQKDGEGTSYFTGVVEAIEFLLGESPTRTQFHNWLDSVAVRGGGEINEMRIDFLFRLGLAYEDQDVVRATPIGKEVAERRDAERFLELLFGQYPDFGTLMEHLSEKPQHPRQLAKSIGNRSPNHWAVYLRKRQFYPTRERKAAFNWSGSRL